MYVGFTGKGKSYQFKNIDQKKKLTFIDIMLCQELLNEYSSLPRTLRWNDKN